MRFREAGSFLIAREKFRRLNPAAVEIDLLKRQEELTKHTVQLQYPIHDYRIAGDYDKAIDTMHKEIVLQVKVFSILDAILEVNRKENKKVIANLFLSQKKTQKTITVLTVFIFSETFAR